MGLVKILSLPAICGLVLLFLWYKRWMSGLMAGEVLGIVVVVYAIVQTYRYGLLSGTSLRARTMPAVKLYYKEYQCNYKDVKAKVMQGLKGEDRNMLLTKNAVDYVAIYYDNPHRLHNSDAGRVCAGFALHGESFDDIGINKVLEAANFQAKVLQEGDAETMSLPKVDDLSYSVSLLKTMSKLWELAQTEHKDADCVFQWEEKAIVVSGIFVGKHRDQYLLSTLAPASAKGAPGPSQTQAGTKKTK
jgi:hypothetical protein